MLSIIMWEDRRNGFVAWSLRGRCYYSLPDGKRHPVTEYFNERLSTFRDLAFLGETYVVQKISEKSYMTEFSKSMSRIKNPRSAEDVSRIKLAVFDYVKIKEGGGFESPEPSYIDRYEKLEHDFKFLAGCDNGVVHLPDCLKIKGRFQDAQDKIQDFWNEFIGERRFEGMVMRTNEGETYKIKFRDTLDAAIIALRMSGNRRPTCKKCGTRFDALWLRKLAREGSVERSLWFDRKGYLLRTAARGDPWVSSKNMDSCPLCGGAVSNTAGPILGAKVALMTPNGDFVEHH